VFDTFEFPEKLNLDEEMISVLKALWNTEYSDLYDDEFFGKANLSSSEIGDDLETFFSLSEKCDENRYRQFISIGESLCLAVYPAIEGYLDQGSFKPFEMFINLIEAGDYGGKELPSLPKSESVPGAISESVSVFEDMLSILDKKHVHTSLMNMIDSCIVGDAICHGSQDKRAIFNWFLTYVLPYSIYHKVPKVIYSIKTVLPKKWNYS
jgi:hypothetical protein